MKFGALMAKPRGKCPCQVGREKPVERKIPAKGKQAVEDKKPVKGKFPAGKKIK